ncbi:ATP synthase F0, A subunit [Anaeromyxobacter dehalogenans 2CP-1]|uniref:ATP synthase subunit a n=1 Tax=Anaeromyxobacter dehalogenans (strain ATCC BAA-258 / DSM 21875 / 2CP-1) TaxID=455488 RepID=ATP6_ANAD2|nr:F0F1 ATP synthase subunit A [Anaeromyxobacter dehalogenans]B8JCU2.1 RecName: Full=ATP synthase subunit a; AltName: Full=ATP synthase F0 sector subunit a; AltName: Full=F-ATPase subunit 6 [Anaeromyxobacter dehalogenans 2CP-1]ACL67812.1 ATP synthase F0, A subunit [Anaeromyxobacter dehalogenans 2CP-1]
MTAATLVTLALSLSLAQHDAAPAPAAAPVEQHGAPAPEAAAPDAHAAPAGEHGAAVEAHAAAAGEHGDAAGHEGGHDESLGAVMMHHVTDGYVIEHPGFCHGALAWNCEWDLRETFGDALRFGALDMTPTKHVMMMWFASALLLVVVLAAVRKKSLVPRGLYNFIEVLVAFVRNEIAVKNIGERDADRFVPYLVTAFFFILFLNLFGLIPFSATATANLSVTVALALFTFLITQYAAIRAMGVGGYLAHLTGGVPKSLAPLWIIMIPVEFLGLFTKPFALTVRLFANMVAGHFVILALLGLIFALGTPWVAFGSVPMALGIFLLELFVAFVQAYIFTMLSSLFIGAGLVHHGDDHGHAEEHGHAGPGMGSEHGSHVAGASPGHG